MAIKRPAELFDNHSITEIKHIENVDIEFAEIDDEIVNLRGRGTVVVELRNERFTHFGNENNEFVEFDFSFRLKLNVSEKTILLSYYKIDTNWFDE